MAPVSIKPLPLTLPPLQTLPHGLACVFGPAHVATSQNTKAGGGGILKPGLLLAIIGVEGSSFQPFLCSQIQNGGKRLAAAACLMLQTSLKLG